MRVVVERMLNSVLLQLLKLAFKLPAHGESTREGLIEHKHQLVLA